MNNGGEHNFPYSLLCRKVSPESWRARQSSLCCLLSRLFWQNMQRIRDLYGLFQSSIIMRLAVGEFCDRRIRSAITRAYAVGELWQDTITYPNLLWLRAVNAGTHKPLSASCRVSCLRDYPPCGSVSTDGTGVCQSYGSNSMRTTLSFSSSPHSTATSGTMKPICSALSKNCGL